MTDEHGSSNTALGLAGKSPAQTAAPFTRRKSGDIVAVWGYLSPRWQVKC